MSRHRVAHAILFAVAFIATSWIIYCVTRPPVPPKERIGQLMNAAQYSHKLGQDESEELAQLIRSSDPDVTRWALGCAQLLTKSSPESKAIILHSIDSVRIPDKDEYDLGYATKRAKELLTR